MPIFWFSAHIYLHVVSVIWGFCSRFFAAGLILLYSSGRANMCWCLCTKKSTHRRFSPSPELMLNFSIVPETEKSACERFFCTRTPTYGIAPSCIPEYSIVCEIWELNSQYFVFCMRTRVRAKYTPKWDVFCTDTVLGCKYEILGVQRANCAGNRV